MGDEYDMNGPQYHKMEVVRAAKALVDAIEAANLDGLEVGLSIGWGLERVELPCGSFQFETGYRVPTIKPRLRKPAVEF